METVADSSLDQRVVIESSQRNRFEVPSLSRPPHVPAAEEEPRLEGGPSVHQYGTDGCRKVYLDFLVGEIGVQRRLLDTVRRHRSQPGAARCGREARGGPATDAGRGRQSQHQQFQKQRQVQQRRVEETPRCTHRLQGEKAECWLRSGEEDLTEWSCAVEPAPAEMRSMLQHVLGLQRCGLVLGRAVRSVAPAARRHFDMLRARDAALLDGSVAPPFHALFCGFSQRGLAAAIAAPFGFASCHGAVLLFALDLAAEERFRQRCSVVPSPAGATLAAAQETAAGPGASSGATKRLLLAELALGRCESGSPGLLDKVLLEASRYADLMFGSVPMLPILEKEFRRGADSMLFPGDGIVAVLSPARALPLCLAEYGGRQILKTAS